MSSGQTAQDKTWKSREQAEETRYVNAKEQEQLAAIRENIKREEEAKKSAGNANKSEMDRNFEGGFGGQEDLEDRYATTLGEH